MSELIRSKAMGWVATLRGVFERGLSVMVAHYASRLIRWFGVKTPIDALQQPTYNWTPSWKGLAEARAQVHFRVSPHRGAAWFALPISRSQNGSLSQTQNC